MNENDLPIINLFSLEELQRMALYQALAHYGIDDPAAFLEENTVDYKCALKGNVGLAITIIKIARKVKPAKKEA